MIQRASLSFLVTLFSVTSILADPGEPDDALTFFGSRPIYANGGKANVIVDDFGWLDDTKTDQQLSQIAAAIEEWSQAGINYAAYYALGGIESEAGAAALGDAGKLVDLDGSYGDSFIFTRSAFREYMINAGKTAIDLGTNYFLLDNASPTLETLSFDDEIITDFRTYLEANYTIEELSSMGVTNVATFDYRDYLKSAPGGGYTDSNSVNDTLYSSPPPGELWEAWKKNMKVAERAFFEEWTSSIRAYAQSEYSRDVYFGANRYTGVRQWDNIDKFDFGMAETFIDSLGYPYYNLDHINKNIRNFGKRFWSWNFPANTGSFNGSNDPYGKAHITELSKVFLSETLASGGLHQVPIDWTSYHHIDNRLDSLAPYYQFARSHSELFNLDEAGEMAVVYNEAFEVTDTGGFTPGYRGIMMLLGDVHRPFDVLFAGDPDKRDGADPFASTDLSKYKAIVLPNTRQLTNAQVTKLESYLSGGGVVIGLGQIADLDENGNDVSGARNFDDYFTSDGSTTVGSGEAICFTSNLGKDYHENAATAISSTWEVTAGNLSNLSTYQAVWASLVDMVVDKDFTGSLSRLVHIHRYQDLADGSQIYQMVNRDINMTEDVDNQTMNDTNAVSCSVAIPADFDSSTTKLSWVTVESPTPVELSFTPNGGFLDFTLPSFSIWGILKVGSIASSPIEIDETPEAVFNLIADTGGSRPDALDADGEIAYNYWYWKGGGHGSIPWDIPYLATDDNEVDLIRLFYRYSTDSSTWGDWNLHSTTDVTGTNLSGNVSFDAPDGEGFYQLRIQAVDGAGQEEVVSADRDETGYAVDETTPNPPLNVAEASNETGIWIPDPSNLVFSWNEPIDNLSGYLQANVSIGSDADWITDANLTENTLGWSPILSGLTLGDRYKLTFTHEDKAGNWASGVTLFTFRYGTLPVTDLENIAVTEGDGKLTVTWTNPEDNYYFASFSYRVAGDLYVNWTGAGSSPDSNATSHDITGLTNGITYQVKANAVSTGGEDGNEIVVSGTYTPQEGLGGSEPGYPQAPTNLFAADNNAKIDLQWDDNSNNETEFVVERRLQGNQSWSIVTTIDPNSTTFQDELDIGSDTYEYRVKAVNGNQNSPYSNIASITRSGGGNSSLPTITLNGESLYIFTVGEILPFEGDPGATAVDSEGNDISNSIEVSGNVDFDTPGEYVIYYTVKDSNNYESSVMRIVNVLAAGGNFSDVTYGPGSTIGVGLINRVISGHLEVNDDDGILNDPNQSAFEIVVQSDGGWAEVSYDGHWKFYPNEGWTGDTQFAVEVSDALGNKTIATIYIAINDLLELSLDSLIIADTDVSFELGSNAILAYAPEDLGGGAYIIIDGVDGESFVPIKNEWDDPIPVEETHSWDEDHHIYGVVSKEWSKKPYAVERQPDGSYKMISKEQVKTILKTDNDEGGKAGDEVSGDQGGWSNWIVNNISETGTLNGEAEWDIYIVDLEPFFNQDLNGDNYIGFSVEALQSLSTDTVPPFLKTDSDDYYYIVEADGNYVKITDENGWAPNWLSDSWSWSDPDSGYSETGNRAPVAVTTVVGEGEQGEFSGYLMLTKSEVQRSQFFGEDNPDNYNENRTEWFKQNVFAEGVLDWDQNWVDSVVNLEELFGEDLNGDEFVGFNAEALLSIGTDLSGVLPKKDADGNTYIVDNTREAGDQVILITNEWGDPEHMEWSNSHDDGSYQSEIIAVESSETGYLLIRKVTDTYRNWEGQTETNVNYEVFSINSAGVLTWDNVKWIESAVSMEEQFESDLDGDGVIGFNVGALVSIDTDTTGAVLKTNEDQHNKLLWAVDGEEVYSIINEYGDPAHLIHSDEWSDGSHKAEAIAVEKQSDGTYLLAIRMTNTSTYFGEGGPGDPGGPGGGPGDPGGGPGDPGGGSGGNPGDPGGGSGGNPGDNGGGSGGNPGDNGGGSGGNPGDNGGEFKSDIFISRGIAVEQTSSTLPAFGDFNFMAEAFGPAFSSATLIKPDLSEETMIAFDHNSDPQGGGSGGDPGGGPGDNGGGSGGDPGGGPGDNGGGSGGDPGFAPGEFGLEKYFANEGDLNAAYPEGNYSVRVVENGITTTHGPIANSEGSFPVIPGITNWDDAQTIDPDNNFTLSWTPFSNAGDEAEIMVNIWNNSTEEEFGSDDGGYLKGDSGGFLLPSSFLQPNSIYSGEVIFINPAIVPTTSNGVFINSSYHAVTKFSFQTGDGSGGGSSDSGGLSMKLLSANEGEGGSPDSGGLSMQLLGANEGEGGVTETHVDWQIHTLTTNEEGGLVLDWNKEVWTQSIISFEGLFNQDLNEDGSIGLSVEMLVKYETDTSGARIYKDTEGSLYILLESGNFISITEEWGGSPNFDWSWEDKNDEGVVTNSEKTSAFAVEAITNQESGETEYKLAISHLRSWAEEDGQLHSQVEWEIVTISDKGVIYWDQTSWGAISQWEEVFGQDMNTDGAIGFNYGALIDVETDDPQSNSIVKLDEGNALYVFALGDTQNFLTVRDNWGGTPTFNHKDSYRGNTHESTVYAVEKIPDDGTYKLAIRKRDTSYNDEGNLETHINWEIHLLRLSEDGESLILNWDEGIWTSTIISQESTFNQDLNDDGGIGLSPDTLNLIDTDTSGEELYSDNDGSLYIKDGNEFIAVMDEWGGAPSFNNSWNDAWSSGQEKPFAVEKQEDGSFKLAIQSTHTNRGGPQGGESETWINWGIFTLNSKGVFNWESSEWTDSIMDLELSFNQDMNGDSSVGFSVDILSDVETDAALVDGQENTSDWYLKRSLEDALYIFNPITNELIAIKDEWGYAPGFFNKDSWSPFGGGTESHESSAVAAEAIYDENNEISGFVLAVKHIHINREGESFTDWEVFNISKDGGLKWGESSSGASIMNREPDFKQDLNGDGGIGLALEILTAIITDQNEESNSSNAYLFKDASDALYILLAGETQPISITDEWGGGVQFNWSWKDQNNSGSVAPLAVEKMADESFKLAVKHTNVQSYRGSEQTNVGYEIFSLTSGGALDWGGNDWVESIVQLEPSFNSDLDGDGAIGFNEAALISISGSAQTLSLKKNTEGNLFIKPVGKSSFAIVDPGGYPLTFNHSDQGKQGATNWTFTQEAVAIMAEVLGEVTTYKLAVKNSRTWGDQDEVSWEIFSIDEEGSLDWEKTAWVSAISGYEESFGQDLNNDEKIGIVKEDISTDTKGATLQRDTENGLYVVDGSSTISIRDADGGVPQFDYIDNWQSFTRTSSAYAVEKLDSGAYIIAIKIEEQETGSEKETFWETFQISSTGIIDWDSGTWGSGIVSLEETFNMDLNNDGEVGIKRSSLTASTSDTKGAILNKDSENGLYINDETLKNPILAIVDEFGSSPNFDFSENWAKGSFVSVSHAVEKLDDGSYQLAIKVVDTYNDPSLEEPIVYTGWQIINISNAGVIDWNSELFLESLGDIEKTFNEDMDGDGIIGINERSLVLLSVSTDTQGETLKKDDLNNLYIALLDKTNIQIKDPVGGTVIMDNEQTLSDGTKVKYEPYAVESFKRDDLTFYKLLIKETSTLDGEESNFWETYVIDSNGVLDWGTHAFSLLPSIFEQDFNQDINGNGEIDVTGSGANATDINTDTTGVGLQTDADLILYIKSGSIRLPIKDVSGGFIQIEEAITFDDGFKFSVIPYAVEQLPDETYRLAVKVVSETPSGDISVTWDLFPVSKTGVIDVKDKVFKEDSELNEREFNQDLNGDGTLSSGVSKVNSRLSKLVTTGTTSAEVMEKFGKSAESAFMTIKGKDDGQDVTLFSEGEKNGSKSNYGIEVEVAKVLTETSMRQAKEDMGLEGNTEITPLTDLLNFTIVIDDPNKFGKIHRMTFAIPEGTTNASYMKQNLITLNYFLFEYDVETGEGARIESSDPTQDLNDMLVVYIRDNGKFDDDKREGYIMDPGAPVIQDEVAAPDAPSGVIVTNDGLAKIIVSWTDNSTNETGFRVERKEGENGSWTLIASESANATQYIDTTVSSDTTYLYRVAATGEGTIISAYLESSAVQSVAPSARFTNLSTRALVQTGDNILIASFRVEGGPLRIYARAIGPGLEGAGILGFLADPTMELRRISDNSLVAENDNWRTGGQETEITNTSIPPEDNNESALIANLTEEGFYSIVVRGVNDTEGFANVELYEFPDPAEPVSGKLTNLSTRALVQTGDNILIASFQVTGDAPQRIFSRAIGPGLAGAGISGFLVNPIMELLKVPENTLLSENDSWKSDQQSLIESTTIQPGDDVEAALVATVEQNSLYSIVVRGVNDGEGFANVEVYNFPE